MIVILALSKRDKVYNFYIHLMVLPQGLKQNLYNYFSILFFIFLFGILSAVTQAIHQSYRFTQQLRGGNHANNTTNYRSRR